MQRFTKAIEASIDKQNWFSALFLTLCLPDICGALETPKEEVGKRYKRWFKENLSDKYSPSFSAEDCYYFRCSCLHQGLEDHKRMKHDRIHFIPPPPRGNILHLNKFNNVLQMQIDRFCRDMIEAATIWSKRNRKDRGINKRLEGLIRIYPLESLEPFIKFSE